MLLVIVMLGAFLLGVAVLSALAIFALRESGQTRMFYEDRTPHPRT
jgi:hypothetical protein